MAAQQPLIIGWIKSVWWCMPVAGREHDRNVMRDARENVEAATNRLSEGYEVRLAQLDADRAALAEQVCQLEMEIQNLHGNHLQDEAVKWLALPCVPGGSFCAARMQAAAAVTLPDEPQEMMLQAKRALWAAWRSAAVRRAQHRRSAGAVTKALARLSDGESRRRGAFVAWRMAVHPLRGSAQKALVRARLAAVQHRQRTAHREIRDAFAVPRCEEARTRQLEAASTALRDQVAMHKEAAQAAHASAEERLQQVELQFQESEMIAAEASSQQLLDQKLVSAKLESRLSTASEREDGSMSRATCTRQASLADEGVIAADATQEELRHEMSRLADLLTAAEAEVLEKTSDVENAEERLAAKTAEAHAFEQAELRQQTQEAAIAGRLARLVQQAADQEEEPREVEDESMRAKALMDHIFASAVGIMWSYEIAVLQTSLHAERAALAVLRRSDLQITDAVTEAKSLPVRHVRTDVDEAKNRWRLEHSFSVSAIHKSGTLPETLPLASRTKRLASRSQ
eukprot:s4456_g6.t1